MSRADLADHLGYFADVGVTGLSRDGAWRIRLQPASVDAEHGAGLEPTTAPGEGVRGNTAAPGVAESLAEIREDIGDCTRCVLHTLGRRQIVFGVGNPRAELMFVGEAPGADEDLQGEPFVGRAGQLLTKIIEAIGLSRSDVYIANVIKCRPPGNRDPMPDEIEACEPYLFRQIEFIEPRVIATLGNFATKLLSGKQLGITRVHGQAQDVTLGGRRVVLYPLYHPAAALYTPRMLTVLEEDFARLPGLLDSDAVEPAEPEPEPELVVAAPAEQLGLF
jgi:DNA polymerase